jgi:hypothetical protein
MQLIEAREAYVCELHTANNGSVKYDFFALRKRKEKKEEELYNRNFLSFDKYIFAGRKEEIMTHRSDRGK